MKKKKKKLIKTLLIISSALTIVGLSSFLIYKTHQNKVEAKELELQERLDSVAIDLRCTNNGGRNEEGNIVPYVTNHIALITNFYDNFSLDDVKTMYFEINRFGGEDEFIRYEVVKLYESVEEFKGINHDFAAVYSQRGIGQYDVKFTIEFNDEINKSISTHATYSSSI